MIESDIKLIKTIKNYLVKLHSIQESIHCRIIELQDSENNLPFYFEVEYLNNINNGEYFLTFEEVFSEMSKYLGELEQSIHLNKK